MRLLSVVYLEELVVGGGLAEAAAVLDGLLELGGLGDHVCGFVWFELLGCWFVGVWCYSVGTVVGRNKKVSGMPNDVICTPPVGRARVVGPGPRGCWSSRKWCLRHSSNITY